MREDRKRAVVEALGLPKDVMLGDILLHFTGSCEAVVENFRSLLIYTDTCIKIKAAGPLGKKSFCNLRSLNYASCVT